MNNELQIDYASKLIRFINFILDAIAFQIIFVLHVFIFDGWLEILPKGSALPNFLYFIFLYFLYNLIFEFAFGSTIGKLLTGTKVIGYNETKPNVKTLIIRNICRLIPFDALSFIIGNTGWHDSISKTTVVNK